MKREDVLMEALPYIQQFYGKTIVIKLGGHAMVDPVVLENAIRDAVLLHYVGIRVVLVHGGGPEISEKMKAMGKESVFVGGLRVTDPETLEIAQMVLVGKINKGIVSLIAKCGARGVGLSGSDGNVKYPLVKSGEIIADLKNAKAAMHGKKVIFILDLAAGKAEATAWGCDLTEKYVEINGRYTT